MSKITKKQDSDEDIDESESEDSNDFKKKLKKSNSSQNKDSEEDTVESEDEIDEDSNEIDDEDDEDDEDIELQDDLDLSKFSTMNVEEDNFANFSATNVEKEVLKGKSIQKQFQVWDDLLQMRIVLQKSLVKINQLPSQDLKAYKSEDLKECQLNLAKVLDQMVDLKSTLLKKNPVFEADLEPLNKKRKLNDYENHLEKSFNASKNFQNQTLEEWHDRTRIVGKFSGFETSITRQIEHILLDKSRLVKRTKVKRSNYEAIGGNSEEIFDDDDFYHQLLREVIERKTNGMTDPTLLGQQWLQLQKIRAKAKKKVDTKASKGRKTRFDIHSKLVNFMAPAYSTSNMTQEAKTELFASLFK